VLRENLQRVHGRIRAACHRAGRDPSSVSLVCVTKTVPVERIVEAAALGATDFGENRVQEAREKQAVLGSRFKVRGTSNLQPVRWHLVGHLQRNKARLAVELFDVIHSVDSLELGQELERHAAKRARGSRFEARGLGIEPGAYSLEPLEVMIQVNISGEATKSGCNPDEAGRLAAAVGAMPHLRLAGLMTIPPYTEDPEQARPHFRRLRELRDALQSSLARGHAGTRALLLSMGMSHDFEVAIEEGADLVRIGTAIFKEAISSRQ